MSLWLYAVGQNSLHRGKVGVVVEATHAANDVDTVDTEGMVPGDGGCEEADTVAEHGSSPPTSAAAELHSPEPELRSPSETR